MMTRSHQTGNANAAEAMGGVKSLRAEATDALMESTVAVCEAVIADGGFTDHKTFTYAMHGIYLGNFEHYTPEQQSLIDMYRELENKFGASARGQIVAKLRRDHHTGNTQLEAFGKIADPHYRPGESESLILYNIERASLGNFLGRIMIPLENHHWFLHGQEEPDVREHADEALILIDKGSYGSLADASAVTSFANRFAVGLDDIYKSRDYAKSHLSIGEDDEFLARIQLAKSIFYPETVRFRMLPVALTPVAE